MKFSKIIFSFQSKFEKLLNDVNRPIITNAFQKFCRIGQDCALESLWRLTYSKENILEVLKELQLSEDIIPTGSIITLRDELHTQYKKLYPSFLDITFEDNECQEIFEDLIDCSDPIISAVIYEHIQKIISMESYSIDRILCLLESPEDNLYSVGIRRLSFSEKEADFLKPYHKLIYNLLKAMYSYHQRTNSSTPLSEGKENFEDANFEVSRLVHEPDAVSTEINSEVSEEEEIQNEPTFKHISPEEVLANIDVFTHYVESGDFNILVKIGELGFDLNEVWRNKLKIEAFIAAAKDLT